MKIGNVEVNSQSEYKAGLRDAGRILMLKQEKDIRNPAVAASLYRELKRSPYYFESEVGRQFVRELGARLSPSERGLGVGIKREGYQEISKEESKEKPAAKQAPRRVRETKRKDGLQFFLNAVGVISALVLIYCVGSETLYQVKSYKSQKKMESLQESVLKPVKTVTRESAEILNYIAMADEGGEAGLMLTQELQSQMGTSSSALLPPENEAFLPVSTSSERTILTEYSVLYQKNHDLAGWISIPDTVVNYPVMQTKEDEEYYLRRDFDKEEDMNGLPFLDARCDIVVPADNTIVYAHCMKNGSMFATLLKYKEKEFLDEHPIIEFNTIYEKNTYEIVAVFQIAIEPENEASFRYFNFIDAKSENEFNAFINTVQDYSMYRTGKTCEYGDCLLTLSTCDKSIKNGRFVVVARKCSENEVLDR